MNVLCTGYFDTGFTKDNFPDSPALLASAAKRTVNFGYLELYQIDDLSSIQIYLNSAVVPLGETIIGQGGFADSNEPSDLDYIVLATDVNAPIFYRVTGYHSLDAGTVELYLSKDPLLTMGGVSQIEVLDGITERVSVAPTAGFDEIPLEDDPLLVPTRPLEIHQGGTTEPNGGAAQATSEDPIIVETALALDDMGADYRNGVDGTAYKYVTTSGEDVSVPMPKYIGSSDVTTVQIHGLGNTTKTPGTAYYNIANNPDCILGLNIANGLGLSSAIVSSYRIPKKCLDSSPSSGHVQTIVGVWEDRTPDWQQPQHLSAFPQYVFNYPVVSGSNAYTVKNKRVLCGELNKYTIQSLATGEKIEFKPEELFYGTDVLPAPCMITDPRSSGKPYYRFRHIRNTDGMNTISEFMMFAIRGMQWAEAPQVYTQKSGGLIDNLNYQVDKDISNYSFGASQLQHPFKRVFDTSKDFWAGLGGAFLGYTPGDQMQRFLGSESMKPFMENAAQNIKRDAAFNVSQKVVSPTISFPLNESMRDFTGNGCICYRVRPTDLDIVRMDKLLTMYGNRWTKSLTSENFTNRPNFNYVKASGVVVKYKGNTQSRFKCSSRVADQVSELLSDGVRIWHVRPAQTYYSQAN